MRSKNTELVAALNGRFDDHHGELARMLLDQIDALATHIDTLTTRIDDLITALPAASAPEPGDHPDGGHPAADGGLPVLQRLAEIPGFSDRAAQVMVAELGLDMTRFATAGHLASWAKLTPRTIQSGATPALRQDRQGQPLPQRRARRGRRRRGQDRHLPRRPLPTTGQPPRETQSPRRGGPIDPDHRLAPAGRPHRPLPRPRRRLPHPQPRPRQEAPQPRPPTPGPRLHRHPGAHRRLTDTAAPPTPAPLRCAGMLSRAHSPSIFRSGTWAAALGRRGGGKMGPGVRPGRRSYCDAFRARKSGWQWGPPTGTVDCCFEHAGQTLEPCGPSGRTPAWLGDSVGLEGNGTWTFCTSGARGWTSARRN